MSDTSDYVLTSGPSGRVDADTAINKPISTPATSNEGLKIIGYPVSFQEIESLKKQCQAAAGDRTDAREAILQAILDDYANQFASLKGIFIKNTACEKCGARALVRGSRHEIFQNVRTHNIWADLLNRFNGKLFSGSELDTYPIPIVTIRFRTFKANIVLSRHPHRKSVV